MLISAMAYTTTLTCWHCWLVSKEYHLVDSYRLVFIFLNLLGTITISYCSHLFSLFWTQTKMLMRLMIKESSSLISREDFGQIWGLYKKSANYKVFYFKLFPAESKWYFMKTEEDSILGSFWALFAHFKTRIIFQNLLLSLSSF